MFSLFEQPMSDTNEEQIQEQIASLLTVVLVLVIPTIQKILYPLQSRKDQMTISHIHSVRRSMGPGATLWPSGTNLNRAWSTFTCVSGSDLWIMLDGIWQFKICVTGETTCHISVCLCDRPDNPSCGGKISACKWNYIQVSHILIIFSILFESWVISKKWPSSSQNLHFIQSLFTSPQPTIQFLNIFKTIPSYSHSL